MIEHYNLAYSKFTPDAFEAESLKTTEHFIEENIKSLKEFVEHYFSQIQYLSDWAGLDVCEIGCGLGGLSHFLKSKAANVSGYDFSPLAISLAKDYAAAKNLNIDFAVKNLIGDSIDKKFDIIIDSHLFHCITDDNDRLSFLRNLKSLLKNEQSVILFETMSYHKNMQIPFDYEFDAQHILYEYNGNFSEKLPIRKIARSEFIEEELAQVGLKIKYLYYHPEKTFQVFKDYPNYNPDHLPRVLRVAASL